MDTLFEKLKKLNSSIFYPFHMPGHKRKANENEDDFFAELKRYDITEITDFDDLHSPQGLIRNIETRAARLYGADNAHILINGSTAGILAAISALNIEGKEVLIARNAHKSAYNAMLINDIKADYIWPKELDNPTINCGVDADEIELKLKNEHLKYSCVYITSPTYEGIISDVEEIAKIAHSYNLPLIVDAAHGAHFFAQEDSFCEFGVKNPVNCGADIVIVSLHKTLNSLTQTGLMLVNNGFVDDSKVLKYLSVFQTSSPSYILMSSIENCILGLENKDKTARVFADYKERILKFYEDCKGLKTISLLSTDDIVRKSNIYGFDVSKIVIYINSRYKGISGITGQMILDILHNEYQIELEYASSDFVLALSTYMDEHEDFNRLKDALYDIDRRLLSSLNDNKADSTGGLYLDDNNGAIISYPVVVSQMSAHKALQSETLKTDLSDSIGRISGDYVYAYPPGIPVLVPGEIITEEIIVAITHRLDRNISIRGIDDDKKICVIK